MVKQDEGPIGHDALIFILQIHKGKQNFDGRIVWGRSMRHADVSVCSIEALDYYLVMRFNITKETIDITDNKSWFNSCCIRRNEGTIKPFSPHSQSWIGYCQKLYERGE
jgi:hypothetical protein